MGAAVESGAAGEETVAVGDLADILIAAAGRYNGAGAAVFPEVNIMLVIESDNALAGRAGRGLDPYTILQGHADQAVGIGFPQVLFGKKRQLVQIVDGFDIIGRDSLRFHLFAVVGNVVPDMPHLFYEFLVLNGDDLVTARAFNGFLEILFHS